MKKIKKIDVLDTSWEPELRDKINSLIEAVEALEQKADREEECDIYNISTINNRLEALEKQQKAQQKEIEELKGALEWIKTEFLYSNSTDKPVKPECTCIPFNGYHSLGCPLFKNPFEPNEHEVVHPNACECKLCCPLPLGFEIHPDGAVTTATKPPKRSHSTKDGNKQLREALTEEIMLNSELNQKEATLLLDAILSTISEALPKEQKEHKTLIVEYGYGRKTQIHPLSDWDLGYNQCLSDIHQLLKKDTL